MTMGETKRNRKNELWTLLLRKENLPELYQYWYSSNSTWILNLKYWLILTLSFQLTSLPYNSIHVGEYLKARITDIEKGNYDILGKSDVENIDSKWHWVLMALREIKQYSWVRPTQYSKKTYFNRTARVISHPTLIDYINI